VGGDARRLCAELEDREPRTSRLISDLLTYRDWRRRRAWLVEAAHHELAAVLVLTRACFDRWTGSAFVNDGGAAPEVARLIDRSVAWTVSGAAADIQPLIPYVRRTRRVLVSPWGIVPYPAPGILGPPDEHSRAATMLDLDNLVDLYDGYEISWPTTRWQLRQYMCRLIDRHLVLVYEREGQIVAATTIAGRTRKYAIAIDLTVRPDFRRAGIGWEMGKRVHAVNEAWGVGVSGALGASNPMMHEDERVVWDPSHFYTLALGGPRRFKGETRLRRLYARVQQAGMRRAELFRDPENPDRPPPPPDLADDRSEKGE
jgi:hypothetical protein